MYLQVPDLLQHLAALPSSIAYRHSCSCWTSPASLLQLPFSGARFVCGVFSSVWRLILLPFTRFTLPHVTSIPFTLSTAKNDSVIIIRGWSTPKHSKIVHPLTIVWFILTRSHRQQLVSCLCLRLLTFPSSFNH
jgi:hypothetical protein